MRSVMVDIAKTTRSSSYSEYFIAYMQQHANTDFSIRKRWKCDIEARLDAVRRLWTSPAFQSPAGKPLSNFAESALDRNTPGYSDVVDAVLCDPLQNVADLCRSRGLQPERSAAWFVADAIADLERYVELMDVWPYIIRAIDFEVRRSTPELAWLSRDIR